MLFILAIVWGMLLLFTVLAGGGSVSNICHHYDAQQRFRHTVGTVNSSGFDSYRGCAKIIYTYTVSGKPYRSDRDFFSAVGINDSGFAKERIAANPPGKSVDVFYDPTDPAQSVLTLETPGVNYWGLLFVQVFLFMMIPVGKATWFAFRPQDDQESPDDDEEYEQATYSLKIFRKYRVASSISVYLIVCIISMIVIAATQGIGHIDSRAVFWAWIAAATLGLITYAALTGPGRGEREPAA